MKRMTAQQRTRMLTEGGLMIALAILLSYIVIYQAPNGGSISAGSMIPLLIFAIRWGTLPGILVGALYGVLDFLIKPYFYHPLQFLLDYPIAFGLLGLAGIGYLYSNKDSLKQNIFIVLGVALGIFGRMVSHVLSGVIFFSEYAGTQNPWLYSIGYNATYLVPEFIISVIILLIVYKPIKNINK
ncbi:MAG TPA: energy-coupled thiamine transporter ThiT [Erysipelothrix sp.]|nr:energy-coupled thiamine transporter ThiT [Erysipelothrix sp.]